MAESDDIQPADDVFELLGHYGVALFRYSGNGVLTATPYGRENAEPCEYSCSFSAAQLRNGEIVIACDMDADERGIPMAISAHAFRGESGDGTRFEAVGLSQIETLDADSRPEGRGVWLTLRARTLGVRVTDANYPVGELRFGLTNYLFEGGPSQVNGRAVGHALRLALSGRLDGSQDTDCQIVLAAVENYRAVAARLRTLKDIAVTAEARVALSEDSKPESSAVTTVIDALAYVLSVGAGTKVQWVYRNSYTHDGQLIARHHSSRIVKPFTPQAIIDARAGWGDENRSYVERAFWAYQHWKAVFPVDHVIDAYLDAKAEKDFLETRGAKLAVALESLKHHFATREGAQVGEYRMAPKVFAKVIKRVVEAVRGALVSIAPDFGIEPELVDALADRDNFMGMNRTSFRALLSSLLSEIQLNVADGETSAFIKSRNALVHQGRFACVARAMEKEEPRPEHDAIVAEYLADVHLLDRIMLRLLDHKGKYLDRSKAGHAEIATLEAG